MKTRKYATALLAFGVAALSVGCIQSDGPEQNTGLLYAQASPAPDGSASLLHGRVTANNGVTYEGHLRFGRSEEILWTNYFNGFKAANHWAKYVPDDLRPRERAGLELFGREVIGVDLKANLGRPWMVRFGDISQIEAQGRDITVAMKSGTVIEIDRYGSDDFADGVRVWDPDRGVVDLDEKQIRRIEFFQSPGDVAPVAVLNGTVRTTQGTFAGRIQWDREATLGIDLLRGNDGSGVQFQDIAGIEKHSSNGSLVMLADGDQLIMTGTRAVGEGNRGLYVDDARFGRVLVSWDAFEAVDFGPQIEAPAFNDFAPGRALVGSVTTRDGSTYSGRLVYDLDESETTETLDAPIGELNYSVPFGMIARIETPPIGQIESGRARVTLINGEELRLEMSGDLGPLNGGILVFRPGADAPDYITWKDVARVEVGR